MQDWLLEEILFSMHAAQVFS